MSKLRCAKACRAELRLGIEEESGDPPRVSCIIAVPQTSLCAHTFGSNSLFQTNSITLVHSCIYYIKQGEHARRAFKFLRRVPGTRGALLVAATLYPTHERMLSRLPLAQLTFHTRAE